MKSDEEIEMRIREELYHGCVEAAKELSYNIVDHDLRVEMRRLIYEYECG